MTDERLEKAKSAALTGIVSNCALAVLKGIAGILGQSKALLADAAFSASNAAGAVSLFIDLRASKLPPAELQLKAQARKEPISPIFISVLILLLGIEMGISSIKKMVQTELLPPDAYAIAGACISLLGALAMLRFAGGSGYRRTAPARAANERQLRMNLFAAVVVLAGVLGAVLGQSLNLTALYYLDPLAAMAVSMMVLKFGYAQLKEVIYNKLDAPLKLEDDAELIAAVQRMKGVIAVDNLCAREQGHYVIVDMKISVNPRISVLEGYEIARSVKLNLMKRFIHITDVMVQVHPYDPGYPYKHNTDLEHDDFPTIVH